MAFADYTGEMQIIVLNNHEYITKWFVFLVLCVLSFYFVFIYWKSIKKTKYFTIALLRLFGWIVSFAYMITIPFNILLMSPELSFYDFYGLYFVFYSIIFSIGLIVTFVDFMRYGILGAFRFAGLDFGDRDVDDFVRQVRNNKMFMKFKWFRRL